MGILPNYLRQEMMEIDTLRTLTLMIGAGLNNQRNAENQLKKYLSQWSLNSGHVCEEMKEYYKFWSQFLILERDLGMTENYLQQRFNLLRNERLLSQLGMNKIPLPLRKHASKSQHEFSRILIGGKYFTSDQINSIYK